MSVWKRLQRVGKRASKFRFTASYQELSVAFTNKWYDEDYDVIDCVKNTSIRTCCNRRFHYKHSKLGLLNEVRIFEASVFNSEIDSNFTNSKLNSDNLSQDDSQGVSFTVRSYDLARPGVAPPLIGGLLAVSYYLNSLADISIVLPCWSAHPWGSQHQTVLREYSSFTESIISHKQCAKCQLLRGPRRHQLLVPLNIKVRSAPTASTPLPSRQHGLLSSRRHWEGHPSPVVR